MLIEELKKILIELKVTPEEFANNIGVGKSAIYKLLRGDTKKLTKNLAEKINAVYPNYQIDYLVSLNYPKKGNVVLQEQGIIKDGVCFSLDEVISFVVENEEELMKNKIFKNIIEIKVSKRIAEITSSRINLENYLNS